MQQRVLENTERIKNNEMMIFRTRIDEARRAQKLRESEDRWQKFLREDEESFRKSKERMDRLEKLMEESRNETRELKEMFRETDRRIEEHQKECDRQALEYRQASDKRIEEYHQASEKRVEEYRQESDKRIEEYHQASEKRIEENRQATDKRIEAMFKETNASISRISKELLGTTGHIVEGLVSSSTEKIFQDAGFDLYDSGKNVKRTLGDGNGQMEVDVMLGNEQVVVPVEVKTNFTVQKVKRFLHRMGRFREFFPECSDKEVLAAVAALNYEPGADTFAKEEGLLVIRVSSDDIFTLDPVPDKSALRRF